MAETRGYRADHVVQRGWSGLKDWQLLPILEQSGFLFVTNNRLDWLRLHSGLQLHDGLIVIVPNVPRSAQIALFETALTRLASLPDLINQVLEVDVRDGSPITSVRPLAPPG